jgi:hypothetical protein
VAIQGKRQPRGPIRSRAECKVVRPPGEMERLRMNQADMERAADESHGRFYALADAEHLLDDLPTGTRATVNAPGPPHSLTASVRPVMSRRAG